MAQEPTLHAEMKTIVVMTREAAQPLGREYPMTRNDQRKPVRAAGLADRAWRAADVACDITVRKCRTNRNRADDSPDRFLESAAARRERQVEAEHRIVKIGLDLTRNLARKD